MIIFIFCESFPFAVRIFMVLSELFSCENFDGVERIFLLSWECFFYCESSYSVVRIVFIVRKFGLVETKLDDSFPTAQFSLSGFSKPYRLHRSSNVGGILLHIRDKIPSRLLTGYKVKGNLELFLVEVNIRKKKWLLGRSYNQHQSNISSHLHHPSKGRDVYLKSYDNNLITRDLN